MRQILSIALAMGVLLILGGSAASAHHREGHESAAGGVSGPAFFVDGEQYRTVGTPTTLPYDEHNAHAFDAIYAIPGVPNVAEAAPGDTDFNGGRWMVVQVEINVDLSGYEDLNGYLLDVYGDPDGITSDSELFDYEAEGVVTVTETILRYFECPVIHVPDGHSS